MDAGIVFPSRLLSLNHVTHGRSQNLFMLLFLIGKVCYQNRISTDEEFIVVFDSGISWIIDIKGYLWLKVGISFKGPE